MKPLIGIAAGLCVVFVIAFVRRTVDALAEDLDSRSCRQYWD